MSPLMITLILVGVIVLVLFGACGVGVYSLVRSMNVHGASAPADLPVYPGARRQTSFEMAPTNTSEKISTFQWVTKDPPSRVKDFYNQRLSEGDWEVVGTSATGALEFQRRSNPGISGRVVVTPSIGQTVIQVQMIEDTREASPSA